MEPSQATEAEFEAIHAAVMETARGRWFLAEFARRRRAAETRAAMAAVARLEARVAALPGPGAEAAPDGTALGKAAARVGALMDALERIQDATWELRDAGAEAGPCRTIEAAAAALRTGLAELEALLQPATGAPDAG